MLKLSVVLPCHNEEGSIENLVTGLLNKFKNEVYEIIIVDDRSSDRTGIVADALQKKNKKIKVIHRKITEENKSKIEVGLALKEGYLAASGDSILSIDSDFAMSLDDIERVLKEFKKGNADMVIGSRFCKNGKLIGYPNHKLFANRLFHSVFRFILGIDIHDLTNNFKVFNRDLIKNIDFKESGFSFNAETGVFPAIRGYKIKEVPVIWKNRSSGSSSFNVLNVAVPYLRVGIRAFFEKYFNFSRV